MKWDDDDDDHEGKRKDDDDGLHLCASHMQFKPAVFVPLGDTVRFTSFLFVPVKVSIFLEA